MTGESGARASSALAGELRTRPLTVLLAGACDRGTSGSFTLRHGPRVEVAALRRGRLVERSVAELERLFALPDETTWSFREDGEDVASPTMDTWQAIWHGLRDRPVPPHVRRALAKVEGSLHLESLAHLARFGLSDEERGVCERLFARPSTLAILLASGPLSRERTELLVYLLTLSRSVVRVDAEPVGPAGLGVHGVRERARRIDDEDARTVLGLSGAVSIEAARAAYFRLARLWHPDRIPDALAEVRSECEHVFMKLGEAHRILTDTTAHRRAADRVVDGITYSSGTNGGPLRGPAPTGPGPERSGSGPDSGRITMREVDGALARDDLEAADTFAHALSSAGSDGPAARAVIAWCACGAGRSTSRESLGRAHAALDKILTGDPDCVRALFYRAQIGARLGRAEAALRDYRKVVRLEPRHVEARRELRLYDIRKRAGAGGPPAVHIPADRTSASTNPSDSRASPPTPPRESGQADQAVRSGLRRLIGRVVGR